MTQSPQSPGSSFLAVAAGSLSAATSAHAGTPMTFLRSFGKPADAILPLTWGMMTISIVVVVVITALLIYGLLGARRYSSMATEERELGPAGGGLAWLYVGVGVSTAVLFATAAWAMVTLAATEPPHGKPAFTIEITGHQWWWQVRYLSDQPSRTFNTANEIHIPVGEPVRVKLASADVIHSFWIPALGGKTDLIPGQTNVTWIEADKPGIYRGQCTEYCGKQHAKMRLSVVASKPKAFDKWWNAQLKGAPPPKSETAVAGEATFIQKCGICHTVRGTRAQGIVGPNLSHLMERHTIAAGVLPNNTGSLAGWISNPQAVKPGSYMPQPEVSPAQLQRILAFLQTLK
jgi:cytochrome c oxidase subunit II